MTPDEKDTISDERDIERALIRLARAMDDRDWAQVSDIIAEDATGDLGTGTLHGCAAIVELVRSFLDNCGATQHLLGNILIDVSGDHATSRSYVHDLHLSSGSPERTFHTLGDYHDRWERRLGEWRLVERIKHNRASVGSMEVFGG